MLIYLIQQHVLNVSVLASSLFCSHQSGNKPCFLSYKQGTDEGGEEETAEGTEKAVFKQLCLLFCKKK